MLLTALYSFGSVFFVALFVTLGKVSIIDVDSNLNTAFRARVVLDMAWVMATVIWKLNEVRSIQRGELVSVPASGAATFASSLRYYLVLWDSAPSMAASI